MSEAESTQVNQKPLPFAPPHPKQQPAHRCDSVPCHWRYQPRALIHLLVHFQTEMLNHRISGRGAKTVELSTEDVQGCRSLQGVSLQDEGGILSCKTKPLPCKMGHGVHRSCRYFPPLGTQQQRRESPMRLQRQVIFAGSSLFDGEKGVSLCLWTGLQLPVTISKVCYSGVGGVKLNVDLSCEPAILYLDI